MKYELSYYKDIVTDLLLDNILHPDVNIDTQIITKQAELSEIYNSQ